MTRIQQDIEPEFNIKPYNWTIVTDRHKSHPDRGDELQNNWTRKRERLGTPIKRDPKRQRIPTNLFYRASLQTRDRSHR